MCPFWCSASSVARRSARSSISATFAPPRFAPALAPPPDGAASPPAASPGAASPCAASPSAAASSAISRASADFAFRGSKSFFAFFTALS
ncbi:MAG: hypothetical protein CMN31_20650 [Sandaracinus sp.]|nr:hypothetical protein [Sandaracinus sp.]